MVVGVIKLLPLQSEVFRLVQQQLMLTAQLRVGQGCIYRRKYRKEEGIGKKS